MNKNYTLLVLIALFAFSAQSYAQSTYLKRTDALKEARVMNKTAMSGAELPPGVPLNESVQLRFDEIIGSSWYDSQSYGCTQNRLIRNEDGTMAATWTMSQLQDVNFPIRGTGFNFFDGTNWGNAPLDVIEPQDRTGWPGICQTADGSLVSIHHSTTGDFRIRSLISNNNGASWTEADITTTDPARMLWPRVAAGGPDGNTVHAFAITTPVANGGTTYQEVDGHLLYYRSLDAGSTWETLNMVIPGLDSTYARRIPADSYALDVNGNNVALAVFPSWADAAVFKSTDNGDTWTKTIIDDFPIDNYVANSGYTFEDIYPDGIIDPESPADSIAIYTTDGSGSVLIDDGGIVHAWFGEMWISDADFNDGDGITNFYPSTSGLAYWNETMGPDTNIRIADVVDANMNDSLDIGSVEEIADYFLSLTSMPNTGIDANGSLYCAYTGVTENFYDATDEQYYRHVYVIKSDDIGETWSDPLDVISPEFIEDLYDFTEAVFPHIPSHNMDGAVNLMFMRDFKAGTNALDDDDLTSNQFTYVELNSELISGTEDVVEAEEIGLKVFPNPASTEATLQIELLTTTNVHVSVIDISGKVINTLNYGDLPMGIHQKTLNTSHLQNGTFFIQVRTDDLITMKKLMVLN